MKKFNVETVELKGSNIVEASAGTGKTFSLAILALRLIIEKEIPISKILMVTFTNAAVAELESRIREFVRLAYKYANGNVIDDDYKIITKIIEENKNKYDVKNRLYKAIRELQNTSILTIHSFCQETLTEFAFETNQIYGAETIEDTSDVVIDEVNEYWRKRIANKDIQFLSLFKNFGIKIGSDAYPRLSNGFIRKLVQEVLNGKIFKGKQECDEDKIFSLIKNLEFEFSKIKDLIESKIGILYFKQDKADKILCELQGLSFHEIYKYIKNKRTSNVMENVFGSLYFLMDKIEERKLYLLNCIYAEIEKISRENISKYIKENNLITYDDLIKNVHTAVIKNNLDLNKELRNKYQAVFIDEFQDTDKLQYEIFDNVFHNHSILFYIGDPKQSIYAWRKADLNVYFKAKTKVGLKRAFTMTTNYRSSDNYVKAMNKFFMPTPKFNTFNFGANGIKYDSVDANRKASTLKINKQKRTPICIYENYENLGEIREDAGDLIRVLLTKSKLDNKEILPKNIGVLVRTGRQATEIKNELQKYSIPAITVDDKKIFESNEARDLLYVLETTSEISWKGINKALLTSFTNFKSQDILKLNDIDEVSKFKIYNKIWIDKGIYSMMLNFISDYNVKSNILDNNNENGERIISNLFQLIEVLQKVESENRYSPKELTNFLNRRINGLKDDSDEYTQRIESDEDAVTIMTIHRSKGLEFDIVIAPYLDFKVEEKFGFSTYRETNDDYCFVVNGQLGKKLSIWEEQQEQENRRLLYVAITRARYNCFIFKEKEPKKKNPDKFKSTMSPFYNELELKKDKLIDYICFSDYETVAGQYKNDSLKIKDYKSVELPKIELTDKYWKKMSFSYLSAEHKYYPKETKNKSYENEKYNQFIFKDLPKGALLGSMLHNIFEFIDFTNDDKWGSIVDISLRQFLPNYIGSDKFRDKLEQMIVEVLKSTIKIDNESFKLEDVKLEKRRSEFEFDINVSQFELNILQDGINELLPNNYEVKTKYNEQLEGILNGFIDLFFEHNGKYYILDWKSNFLGDTIEDYNNEKLVQAMNENNYHLQYLLYTLAIKKYLESKLQNFDYEKHFGGAIYVFLRGVRENEETGLFVDKPSLELIDEIENIIV